MSANVTVTVYTRAGCTLCDRAITTIERVTDRIEVVVDIDVVDVDRDPALRNQYSDRLPVIFIDDKLAFEYYVDEYSIENALRRAAGT